MDMNDNWIEAEIARELDRLGPEDLEDSNHEKENIFNDFLLKFKPPQYTTATQSSYMARYLSLRNEQHNLIREELGIPPSSDEDVTKSETPADGTVDDIQLVIDDEDELLSHEEDEEIMAEIQKHEEALLAAVKEREKFEQKREEEEKQERQIKAVLLIQAHWRGYRVRSHVMPRFLKELDDLKRLTFAAAVIQRAWKEYKLRKRDQLARLIWMTWRAYRMRRMAYGILAAGRKHKAERERLERERNHREEIERERERKCLEEEMERERERKLLEEEMERERERKRLEEEMERERERKRLEEELEREKEMILQKEETEHMNVTVSDEMVDGNDIKIQSITSCNLDRYKSHDSSAESHDQMDRPKSLANLIKSHDSATDSELAHMIALKEIREQEEIMAQRSRHRMNQMMTNKDILEMAESSRNVPDYATRLQHATCSLPYHAWIGVINERRSKWLTSRQSSINSRSSNAVVIPTPSKPYTYHKVPLQSKVLSDAQLLASSPSGTSLDEVTVVHIYKARDGPSMDFSSFSRVPNLHSLSLTNCSLVSFTEIGGANPFLKELSLTSNQLELIDCSHLPSLRFIDMSHNRLSSIHGLTLSFELLELNLDENRIARIGGLDGCGRLQRLTIDGNLLISSIGVAKLHDLQHLSLAENHLPIVNGLDMCHLLQYVNVQQNNLQECISLSNHVLLRELDLSGNSISHIGSIEGAWLPLLQTLNLSNNCITELNSLTCCMMLSLLDLRCNSIYDFPGFLQSLRGCYFLRNLYIDGNPITYEPKLKYHVMKALPNLTSLDDVTVKPKKAAVPKEISSHPLVMLMNRQIYEQDEMKKHHCEKIEEMSRDMSPNGVVKHLEAKIAYCKEYTDLLKYHIEEQVEFDGTGYISLAEKKKKRSKAAIVIQKHWRGRRCRQEYQKVLKGVVMLQSLWRKQQTEKEMRKKCRAAICIQSRFRGYILRKKLKDILSSTLSSCDDDFMNVEEITFDENFMLDAIKPMSPTDEEIDVLLNTVPTAAAKPTQLVPKLTLPGGIDEDVPLESWLAEQSHDKPHPVTSHRQSIMDEWGFTNQSTAESMMKRRNRHKKLHRDATQREKLSNPLGRLDEFHKMNTPERLSQEAERESNKKCSTSYQWVHHKRVIHRQLLSPAKSVVTPTSSSSLPQMELHVLAGHAPRLVTSRAQNELIKQHKSKSPSHAWN